ncbi:MAG: chromate resistance protein [Cytophagales bacterium]|nr:chromate resistance protein [Rhizobacter sp.]
MNTEPARSWLLLILSLPTQSATARMRIWRALKTAGCAALRDGAYLLPAGTEHEAALGDLAAECLREGGSAWLLSALPTVSDDTHTYVALFDRREEYAGLQSAWKQAVPTLASLGAAELSRLRKKLQRDYDALRAIDFFPGEATLAAEADWADFCGRIERVLSPDEPQQIDGQIPRLNAAEYQGRTWATRRRLWVDRVASAWLIHRFIDHDARFQWLAKPADCPRKALGFDFDGATFTHVGDKITFEVLMTSFGLDEDPALLRLAAMVHALDVGGEPVPEAVGFEAVLAGARERLEGDDALLLEMRAVLDSLYTHFQRDSQRKEPKGKNQ